VASDPFSWGDGSRLVNELGSEHWLAQRIQTERKTRGWSQARLSREMAGAGHPMHQSAISKIEPPDPDQKVGRRRRDDSSERRSVTIGEAVGFAKVFGIPLGELLLPPDAVRDALTWRRYLEACEAEGEARDATRRYEDLLSWIRPVVRQRPELAERLRAHRAEVMAQVEAELREVVERDGDTWGPHILTQYRMPPAVIAADDVLRDDQEGEQQ
jgi:transcriptional regulator with XRE-family HTH domain